MALSPLRNLLTLPAPLRARLRMDPVEQTWECPRCGIIEPIALAGGYLRRRCPCAQAAWEAEQQRAQQAALTAARVASTYRWLGQEWVEAEVASRTFATFDPDHYHRAFERAKQFARNPSGVLLLHGSWGTGKTHLLASIANAVNARGGACLFASTVSFFDAIQARIQQQQPYQELLARAIATPLLVLDDLDKLKPSEFREEVFYRLIHRRTGAQRPIALSANGHPTVLERYLGPAACSRLFMQAEIVEMRGTDYRISRLMEDEQDSVKPLPETNDQ